MPAQRRAARFLNRGARDATDSTGEAVSALPISRRARAFRSVRMRLCRGSSTRESPRRECQHSALWMPTRYGPSCCICACFRTKQMDQPLQETLRMAALFSLGKADVQSVTRSRARVDSWVLIFQDLARRGRPKKSVTPSSSRIEKGGWEAALWLLRATETSTPDSFATKIIFRFSCRQEMEDFFFLPRMNSRTLSARRNRLCLLTTVRGSRHANWMISWPFWSTRRLMRKLRPPGRSTKKRRMKSKNRVPLNLIFELPAFTCRF